jgi:F-type H+-transporting ATPase subunit b
MSLLALMAETADYAAEPTADAPFPPFNPDNWESQAFWLLVSFGVLYVLLSRFILPNFTSTIERRSSRIASDLDEAARLNDEAAEAQQALEVAMAKARAEARETAAKTQAQIDASMRERTERADTEIEAKLAEAEEKITTLRASAMDKVEDIAAEAAGALASRLGTTVSASDAKKAVQAALQS